MIRFTHCGVLILTLLAAGGGAVVTSAGELRTWKLDDGKTTIEAEFVELIGSEVKLKKKDGEIVTTLWSKLPPQDRAYTLKLKSEAANKTNPLDDDPNAPAPRKKPFLSRALTVTVKGSKYVCFPPDGAVAVQDAESATITAGNNFQFTLTATSPTDIERMKEEYPPNDRKKGTKAELDQSNLYVVKIAKPGTDHLEWIFVAVVKVGKEKLTVTGRQPADARWTREDVMHMIKTAHGLHAAK